MGKKEELIEEIFKDLKDRRGLRQTIEQIDEDIIIGIKNSWAEIYDKIHSEG